MSYWHWKEQVRLIGDIFYTKNKQTGRYDLYVPKSAPSRPMQNNFMMNGMMMNTNQQDVVTGFATSDANRSFIAAQNDNTNGRGNVAEVTVLDGDQQLKPPVGEDGKSKKSADTESPLN